MLRHLRGVVSRFVHDGDIIRENDYPRRRYLKAVGVLYLGSGLRVLVDRVVITLDPQLSRQKPGPS